MEQPKSPTTPKHLTPSKHMTTHILPLDGNLPPVADVQHYDYKEQLTEPDKDKEYQWLAQCRPTHGHIAPSDHTPYPDDVTESLDSNKHLDISARTQTLHTILALLDVLHALTTHILQLVFQPIHRSTPPGYSHDPLTHLTQSQTALPPQQPSLRNPVTTQPLTSCQLKNVNTSTQPQIPIWSPPKCYLCSVPALLTLHLKHLCFKPHAPSCSCIKLRS